MQERLSRIGDYLDARLSLDYHRKYEAPALSGRPKEMVWYRIPIEEGISGDGSEYHIYYKKGTSKDLCIFFSGGGVAINARMAANPTTGGKMAAGLPNYYWNNLRPLTEFHNIHQGMMQIGNLDNPFHEWNIAVITYSTGDMHIGNHNYEYTAEDGTQQILHFHGYRNFLASMRQIRMLCKKPKRLLIAGDSAGGFAVPALTGDILERFYPDCKKVTVFSDSAQLIYRRWRTTARDLWQADPEFWMPLKTTNLTVDWYRALYERMGDRIRYLYAGSPRDYLLSAYYNDVMNGKYKSDRDVQAIFEKQMRKMVVDLKKITPDFGIFLYPFHAPFRLTGTVHTAVRHPWFYQRTPAGMSLAEWLGDALNGKVYDANKHLLQTSGDKLQKKGIRQRGKSRKKIR